MKQLGELINRSESQIYSYEANRYFPPTHIFKKLISILGLPEEVINIHKYMSNDINAFEASRVNVNNIGDKIKYFRILKGMSQNELGLKIKKHPVHVSRYERNLIVPPKAVLHEIAATLDIEINQLF